MDIRISPSRLCGKINAISSKSDVHRLLIASALADAPTDVLFNVYSKDILATMSCIESLGAKCEKISGGVRVYPSRSNSGPTILNCFECGSTARFLLPLCAALHDTATITGEGSLVNRPFSALCNVMRENGCLTDRDTLPITTHGRLLPGTYEIDGNISSQYITGLMFALPTLDGNSEIVLKTPLESAGYADMTIDTLLHFGVKIEKSARGFFIRGPQKFSSPKSISAEGDWSNSAFWLTAGALGGNVTVGGLCPLSFQKDKQIMMLLSRLGARTEKNGSEFTVSYGVLSACEIDAADIPDIVPIIAVAASVASGTTVIRNAGRLKIKESDRLSTIYNTLTALGANISKTDDSLIITGVSRLRGGIVDGAGDHRIVMSAAIASCVCENEVIIKGAQAAEKSYPDFFADFNKLGGKAHVI